MNKYLLQSPGPDLTIGGCEPPAPETGFSFQPLGLLQGHVYYLARIGIGQPTMLTVTLRDISRMDAPAVTLASCSRWLDKGLSKNALLQFHFYYGLDEIQPGHNYAIDAELRTGDKLWMLNHAAHPVRLDGSDPATLEVLVGFA
jgi:putative lipoprotein